MSTTANVKLDTPPHASNVDIWDTSPINNNSGIIDALFGSVTSKSLTNAPVTLSATEAQVSILRFSGALSGNCAINVSAINKAWICENTTTGAFVVTITGGSGNIVALPPGSSYVYWDGTNVSFINLGRVGFYAGYSGTGVPAWAAACTVPPLLACDGSTFSSGTYPQLAAILGTTTLPDTRGRARFNLNGGTGRVTTSGSGVDGDTRFATGGSQNGTIGQNQLPNVAFNLTINDTRKWRTNNNLYPQSGTPGGLSGGSTVGLAGQQEVVVYDGSIGGTAASGGNGDPLVRMPPTYIGGVELVWAG